MKQIIEIKVHKSYPGAIGELIKAVATSNEHAKEDEKSPLLPIDVVGFLKVTRIAYFPASQFKWVINDNEIQISFSNDFTKGLTLTWKEVVELDSVPDESHLVQLTDKALC